HHALLLAEGQLQPRREAQLLAWFEALLHQALQTQFESKPAVRAALPQLREALLQGTITPAIAAQQALSLA
ncbi:MAG: hypothetical protein RIR70_703, partial [Pseudomonadota bacterium]